MTTYGVRPRRRTARPYVTFETAASLAAVYGTPLQILNRRKLADCYRSLCAGLPGADVCYAVKANGSPEVLRHLASIGANAEVCSEAEAVACRQAGFAVERLLHTHPCKSVANLTGCFAAGVRLFTYDAAYELDKFSRYAPAAELLLRVAQHSTAELDLSSKFGCAENDVPALLKAARARGLTVRGLSFHLGSQCLDPDDYRVVLRRMRGLWDAARRAGFRLDTLDIGGGMPAPYRTPDAGVVGLQDYAAIVWTHLLAAFGDCLPGPPGSPGGIRVIAEPGRAVVAESVTAAVRVLGTAVRAGVPWYFLDDGVYGTFSGQFFGKNPYPVVWKGEGRRTRPCVLAGPTCDSLDVIDRTQPMPDLVVGELLLVPSVGAYSVACATHFNGIAPPKVVAIDDDYELD